MRARRADSSARSAMADAPGISDPTLAALLQEQASVQARLHAYLAKCGRVRPADLPAASDWPAFPDHPGLISVREAAVRARRDEDTVRIWAARHDIGRRYGGRWRVSVERLTRHIETTRPA